VCVFVCVDIMFIIYILYVLYVIYYIVTTKLFNDIYVSA